MQRRRAGVEEWHRGGAIKLRGGGGARVVSVGGPRPLVVIPAAHRGGARWGLRRRQRGGEGRGGRKKS